MVFSPSVPTPHRLSIALCTFNGQAFLQDQLQSILHQTKQPDELVICDDGSTDQTLDIVRSFAAPFPIQIHQNSTTLGPAQNFAKAIAACSGEIISLCDQDDVWAPNKIERTLAAFVQNPQLAYTFSDADVCDQSCKPLGYRLWTSIGFVGRLRTQFDLGNGFDVLLRQNVVTGATLSFAARYRSLILPIPGRWMHDGWIALLLSAIAQGQAIPEPLIQYRQHPNQSLGAAWRTLYQQYQNAKAMPRTVFSEQADQYESALARLQEQTDYEIPAEKIQNLQQKIQHCRRRAAIRQQQTPRLIPALTELSTSRYRRFSLGWKSFAQDLFL